MQVLPQVFDTPRASRHSSLRCSKPPIARNAAQRAFGACSQPRMIGELHGITAVFGNTQCGTGENTAASDLRMFATRMVIAEIFSTVTCWPQEIGKPFSLPAQGFSLPSTQQVTCRIALVSAGSCFNTSMACSVGRTSKFSTLCFELHFLHDRQSTATRADHQPPAFPRYFLLVPTTRK